MCNELTGIVGRVLGDVIRPTRQGVRSLRRALRPIKHWLSANSQDVVLSYEEVISRYTGGKKKRYEHARDSLLLEPISKSDARVEAFVKAEKRPVGDRKDPRIIQFRSFRYTLELARRLVPLEAVLKRFKGNTRVARRSRVIAKGLDTWQHAALVEEKWSQFTDPVCLSLDAARFDKHVDRRALECEHEVWLHALPDPVLRTLLSWQLVNKCRTKSRISYTVEGNRMSGDYNTGCGNCVLMMGMIEAIMVPRRIAFDYLVNSDDALIFVERRDAEAVSALLPGAFREFGHEVVTEEPAFRLEDIVHCQYKPVLINGRRRMVRDFRKVLSHCFAGYKHYQQPVGGMRVLKSVAMCELSQSTGVPILQAFFKHVLTLLEGVEHLEATHDVIKHSALLKGQTSVGALDIHVSEIADETVASFCAAFGVLPDQIVAYEQQLTSITLENLNLHSLCDLSLLNSALVEDQDLALA